MFYGEVTRRNDKGQIRRAIVLRMLRTPALPKKQNKALSGRETDFKYLIVFIPSKSDQLPDKYDYFVFRNRTGETDKLIWYQSLFTISKDMESWGIHEYTVLDGTIDAYPHDVFFTTLKNYLSAHHMSIIPIEEYLTELAAKLLKDANRTKPLCAAKSA